MKQDDYKNFYADSQKKKRPTGKRRKKRRSVLSVLLTIALALTAFLLAAATTGYFLITHRPTEYQPRQWSNDPKIRQEEQRKVNRWADEKVQELNNATQSNAQEDKSFIFRIEQNKLNDLLMTDETQKWIKWKWPSYNQQIRDIQFGFDDKKIKIMGEVEYKDIQTVLMIAFSLNLTENKRLKITLDSLDAGALPLPKSVVYEQLDRITKILKSARNENKDKANHKNESKDVEEFTNLLGGLVQNLFEKRDMDIPAEFPVDVNKKARILALDIGQGYIDLTLKPFWVDD
jgi:uncharacterized protein YpmS